VQQFRHAPKVSLNTPSGLLPDSQEFRLEE